MVEKDAPRKSYTADISADLPLLLHHAYQAYRTRVLAGFPADAKEFTSAQAACRAALAHVMLLLRLEERVARIQCGRTFEEVDGLQELIAQARVALDQ
ncbi:MAG: hypothetical protein JNM75_08905 [Rhodospirillales bacterium]|nr:hypothetical protein [Rhodospirillales bacterium]